ncbi:MAG: GNAT family N-acetyltransferase [Balneolaceae bacterium]|nr:GNAT family N-acetyltransferase [Balneolaceae bacterium]
MIICKTDRLIIRQLEQEDAPFILKLLNDKSFLENIGDKGVRTEEDAIEYLEDGPLESYKKYGFGLNLVTLKTSDTPIGICGLLQRETLEHPDIGYALLPEYRGKGYAKEAAKAVLDDGHHTHKLNTIWAVVSPGNASSSGLLDKLNFQRRGTIDFDGEENYLYEHEWKSKNK